MVGTSIGVEIKDNTRAGAESVNRNLKGIQDAAGQTEGSFEKLQKTTLGMGSAFAALGLTITAGQVLAYASAWQKVENQLKLVTKGADELLGTQDALFKLSQQTRSSYDATGNLYARLSRSTEDLNLSQKDLLSLTGAINQAFVVSGATGQEASQAIIQLSQGFASGALRGDELRSVMEQAPRLSRAMAEGLHVPIGALLKMGEAGELTSDKIAHALIGQAPKLGDEYGRMGTTVGQGLTVVGNAFEQMVGHLDKSIKMTDTLAGSLLKVADLMERLGRIPDWADKVKGNLEKAGFSMRGPGWNDPLSSEEQITLNRMRAANPLGAGPSSGVTTGPQQPYFYEPRGLDITSSGLRPGNGNSLLPQMTWEIQANLRELVDKTYGPAQNEWDKPLDLAPTDTFDAWKKEFEDWQTFMKEMSDNVAHLLPKDYVQQRGDANNRIKAEDVAFEEMTQKGLQAARRQMLDDEVTKFGQLTEVFRGLSPEVDRFAGALTTVLDRATHGDAFGAVTAGLGYVVGAMFGAKTETDRWAGAILDSVVALKQSRQAATDLTLSLPGAASEELKQFQYEAVSPLLGLFESLRAGGPDRKFFEDFRDFTSLTEGWVTKGGKGIPAATMALKNLTGLDEGNAAWAEIVQSVTKTLLPGGFGTTIMDSLKDAFGPETTLQEVVLKMFDVQESFKNVNKAAKLAVDGIGNLADTLAGERFQGEILAARGQLSKSFGQAGGDVFLQRQAIDGFEAVLASIKDSMTLARSRSGSGSGTTLTMDAAGKVSAGTGVGGGSSGVTDPFTFGEPVSPSAWDSMVRLPDPSTRIQLSWADALDLRRADVSEFGVAQWSQVFLFNAAAFPKHVRPWSDAVGLSLAATGNMGASQWSQVFLLKAEAFPKHLRSWDAVVELTRADTGSMGASQWSQVFLFNSAGFPKHVRSWNDALSLSLADTGSMGAAQWSQVFLFNSAGAFPKHVRPWSDAVSLTLAATGNMGASQWSQVFLLNAANLSKHSRPWSDAVEFYNGGAFSLYRKPGDIGDPSGWSSVVLFPATLSKHGRPWSDAIEFSNGGSFSSYRKAGEIGDPSGWSSVVLFPASLSKHSRPWSDVIEFTSFSIPLSNITFGRVSLDINAILNITGKMNIRLSDYIQFNTSGLYESLCSAVQQGINDRKINVRAN